MMPAASPHARMYPVYVPRVLGTLVPLVQRTHPRRPPSDPTAQRRRFASSHRFLARARVPSLLRSHPRRLDSIPARRRCTTAPSAVREPDPSDKSRPEPALGWTIAVDDLAASSPSVGRSIAPETRPPPRPPPRPPSSSPLRPRSVIWHWPSE
ncbi:hypothetical protein DCS_06167 [Drechmeria coniospora]|uniref:Uncharacterized protein n=1 Tax=Drechmeria coniospora TaxID=98403 RepID=A0A151GAU1_DRECN|nr:hypothetical protein DCS_06167 [Drechmeria coniospora]KYK54210.1 hypothetical protein DCS_06167 [Drechmeria coniospora]